MRVTLDLPDDTWEKYERIAEKTNMGGRAASATEIILAHLDRFSSISPTERVIIVDSRGRDRLDAILGVPSVTNSKDLCDRVERLASLKIGNIKVNFTSGQLAQLKSYAARNRKTLDQVCHDVVKQMEMQFFDLAF